jgi:uncharacterized protein involved in exopolysaccharide biosynthesis
MSAEPIRGWSFAESSADTGYAPSVAQRANRRRLRVFVGTLVVALGIGLAYDFLRPAVYRASARVEITPAAAAPSALPPANAPAATTPAEPMMPFLTEVQVLTSRALLEEVLQRLQKSGHRVSGTDDPVSVLQSSMEAAPVANTNVVELVAKGRDAALLAPLLDTTIDVYRDRLLAAYTVNSGDAIAQADAEVAKLQTMVAANRRDVEAYRQRSNIVSLDRDENEVLARLRNQSAALGKANERLATAEGNMRALTEAQAAGNVVVRARDNPTLANLEQRASQAREDLGDMERAYTPQYLERDPRAIALRARLAELDRQLVQQRRASQEAALAEAREESSSAQAAARRIADEIASDRQNVALFTTRFNEYKARQAALAELEKAYGDAVQRRARLEASERARTPKLRVLGTAVTPTSAWRPLYWRDAGIAGAGSFVLALLAMWLTDLFNRSDPAPTVVVTAGAMPARIAAPPLLGERALDELPVQAPPALLPDAPRLPRELTQDEVVALLDAADASTRLVVLLLLSGIDVDETVGLRGSDVDVERNVIRIEGASARDISMSDPLRALVAPLASTKERLLVVRGLPATTATIDAQILCAAHDARLASATEVDARCLRHTFISYLVRQGIRFADLQRLVGSLTAPMFAAYAKLSPAGPPASGQSIQAVFPPLQRPIYESDLDDEQFVK